MSASTPASSFTSTSKKLGKFNQIGHRITGDRKGQSNSRDVGWEYLHVCIDDASRVAFSRIMETERKTCAVAFLKAAVAYYKSLGITVLRVMTDNGSCYRARAFAKACQRLKLKHIRIEPYTPRTNGKAECFIQTSLREWAYARAYMNSKQRAQDLAPSSCQYRRQAALEQTWPNRGQPVEIPQLEREF